MTSNYLTLDRLGRIGRGRSKHRPRNAPHLYGGPYPLIQTADVTNSDLFIASYTQTYTEAGLAQSKLWTPGVLCIVNAGVGTGDNSILNFSSCFPDSIIAFQANKDICEVRFVKYYLDSIKNGIKSITMGATQDNLSIAKLLTFKVPLLSISVQKKIAAILSAYDELIENNNRRIAILEKMAEEIYREWFVRMRFPGHKKVKVVKGVPVGWEVRKISEVVEFQSGFSFKSKTYTPNGSYGIVTIRNVHDGLFNPICTDYIEDIPSNMKDYCNLKRGDILMSLTGNVGRVCIVYGNNLLLNQRVAKLKVSKINTEQYIYYFFRDRNVQELTINLSLGSTAQMNLSPIQLGKQKMIIPDKNTLNLFHKKCSSISENILNYYILNSSLRQSRDLLLPRLISGKLDVEKLDITFPPGMSNSDPTEGKEAEAA